MNSKTNISIFDFNLFIEMMRSAAKIVESAKLTIGTDCTTIYGCRGNLSRCELMTNAILAEEPVEICVASLATLNKILSTVQAIHKDDYSDFKMTIELPKLKFSSKKFKTSFQLQTEDVIEKWLSKKVEAQLVPELEFTTTSDIIRQLNSQSYISDKPDDLRICLDTDDTMEKNSLYATLRTVDNDLSTSMTLKFGIITNGKTSSERKLILDFEHLNLFNALQSDSIKIFLPQKYNMLVSKTLVSGKNDTFFNLNVYNALLKN